MDILCELSLAVATQIRTGTLGVAARSILGRLCAALLSTRRVPMEGFVGYNEDGSLGLGTSGLGSFRLRHDMEIQRHRSNGEMTPAHHDKRPQPQWRKRCRRAATVFFVTGESHGRVRVVRAHVPVTVAVETFVACFVGEQSLPIEYVHLHRTAHVLCALNTLSRPSIRAWPHRQTRRG